MKQAQVEVTFNWIYILIAGTVILLFFIGIAVKQKSSSEQQLSGDIVRTLQSIFTAASVSEKTKNTIDISGLQDYTFYFRCQEGTGEYGIVEYQQTKQDPIQPMFSPAEIKGSQLNLWSLPYKLPFKVIDFLFITSENTQYFLVGSDPFIDEFLNETQRDEGTSFYVNADQIQHLDEAQAENNFQVRIVDFTGVLIRENLPVPPSMKEMEDEKVTAVSFNTPFSVEYYQKQGSSWKKTSRNPVKIISMGGQRDAAKYAAIFAADQEMYECNMEKAFRRLKILNEIYGGPEIQNGEIGGKLREMVQYYEARPFISLRQPDCKGHINEYPQQNVAYTLSSHQNTVSACVLQFSACSDLIQTAQQLHNINSQLNVDCLTLY